VAGLLPPYPTPRTRTELSLIVGEVHRQLVPKPSPAPQWLSIPERGLYTGIASFGSIGSGKTYGLILPAMRQLFAYKADDPASKLSGIVLEAKGDLCRQLQRILKWCGREQDYVEVSLDGDTPQWWIVGQDGTLLGRLDIRFKHLLSKRDYFGFEAKRLHVTYPSGRRSKEYSTYAGEAGMMAFTEGQYSKMLPAGGMLGYVMDGKSDEAWIGIGKQIESQRTALKLSTGCSFARSTLSKALEQGLKGSHLGETDHDLKAHHLRLFHLLLPVQTSSPRRLR
jgi:hypothetical protein